MIKLFSVLFFSVFFYLNSIAQYSVDTARVVSGVQSVKLYGFPNWYPTWNFVAESQTGNKWYLKKTPISNENGKLTIWVKIIFKSIPWGKKIYKNASELRLVEFDFKSRKYKTLETALYASDGSVIYTDNYDYPQAETIFPDSVIEGVYEIVEQRFKKDDN